MSDTIEARFNTVLNTNERLKRELSTANAEIARLTEKCVFLGDANMELLDRSKVADIRAEKAEAEIARLTKRLEIADRYIDDLNQHEGAEGFSNSTRALAKEYYGTPDAALQPDTGELPPCMAPDGGECCPQYHEAKAEIARLKDERDEAYRLRTARVETAAKEIDDAEAEIARLTNVLEQIAEFTSPLHEAGSIARAALKPDTGEGR